MGWLNINGNWIGRNRGGTSWSSYWTPSSAVVENAAPTDIVLTYATAINPADAITGNFAVAGKTISSATLDGTGKILTLIVTVAFVYGDSIVVVANSENIAVTNNITAEAELTTYITGLATPLSLAERRKTNEFIKAIKTGLSITNLSDAFDVIYLLAGETSESSLKNLVKDAHHGTLEGTAPTFTADLGFQNSGSGYIDTHYNPATEADKYLLASCAVGWYSNTGTNTPALQSVYGLGIENNYIVTNINGQEVSLIMNCLAGSSINYNNLQQGTFIFSRTAASVTALYKDKSLDLTDKDTRVAIPNGNIYVLARNLSGTADRFINKQISFFFISKGLIQAEVDAITDAFTGFFLT